MAQSLIDILIRARATGRDQIQGAALDLHSLDRAAGIAAGGLSALAGAAALGGIYQLSQALDELARRGAVFEQLGSVLGDFAASVNSSSDAMISAAKRAAQGTISEYELILNANRSIQFEVAKTPEQFAKLIELSTALGRAQGISDTQALEFITTGLARESRLILDNLGLIIDLDKATADYAATLGKTAGELTQAERKAALLNEAFRQGATAIQANRDAADSAATQYERFDANVQNLRDNFGDLLATAAADSIGSLATQVALLNEQLTGQRSEFTIEAQIRELVAARDALANGDTSGRAGFFAGLVGDADIAVAELDTQIAALNDELTRLKFPLTDMSQAADLSMQAADATGQLERAAYAAAQAEEERARAHHEAARAAAIDATEVVALTAALDKLAGSASSAIVNRARSVVGIVGAQEAQRLAEQQLRTLQEQTLAMESQGLAGLDLIFAYEELEQNLTGVFDTIEEADLATQRWASQSLAAANRQAQELQREFDNLTSKVQGVLQGALDPGVGVDVGALLPREDAINEQARRLADVAVNGYDSPWAEYLAKEFPDLLGAAFEGGDVQQQAAQVLRDFQDGLRPELLDKDKAKERVRRMLIGEAKLSELAQEIAGELAEEFGGLGQDRILGVTQGALGLGGAAGLLAPPDTGEVAQQYSGTGNAAAEAFVAGVQGAVVDGDLGTRVTAALDEQLRAESNLARLTEGGRVSGSAWGSGFLEVAQNNVPPALIELLAVLVTPAVDDILRTNAQLQGAR